MSENEDISDLWEDALDKYEKMAPERSRRDKNLFMTLKTPEALEEHLDKSEKSFKLFRSKHGKLTSRLKACMKPFMALSDMISAAVSLSPFAPASTILGAVCFVLKAADGVSEVYAWIEELFDKLRDFTTRLDEYVQQGLPKGFRDKIVDILGCLLEILACAELAVKDGRWKKYAAVLFLGGDERVKAAFDKLASLFQSEQSLVIAITYATNQKMDKRIEEIGAMSEAILNATNKAQEETKRQECMKWISSMDFTAQQSDNLGRRQANTGAWFLKSPIFTSWADGPASSWGLFCQGAPGAGKTTMSATVINSLSHGGPADEVGVAYIYCNYRSRTEQTLYNLLSSLLRRLVQIRSKVPPYILETFEKFGRDRKLTLVECTNLIGMVCNEFSVVYVVVDAVDECQEDVSRDLFNNIRYIQKQTNMRLMITARFIPDIQDMVQEELGMLPELEVRASDDDIRQYFASRQPRFKNFLKNNQGLCSQASDKVVEAAGGMFLLAKLHVDQLTAMVVPAQVKSALSKMFKVSENASQLIQAYNEQYDLAMERISNQPAYQADLARATLAWMTFACRPLVPAELCTALAMELSDDKSALDQDFLPDIGLLVSICAGLVTVDKEANVIRPAHNTTQEYLERTHEKWFPAGKKMTALTCISYLSMEEFKKGGVSTSTTDISEDKEWNQRLSLFPLLDYAARHWGGHVRPVENVIFNEVCTMLEHPGIRDNVNSVTTSFWEDTFEDYARAWRKLTPMVLIASEGLKHTLQNYLASRLAMIWPEMHEDEDEFAERDSPLTAAAANGRTQIMKILLDQSVDANLWQESDIALQKATEGEHIDILRMILEFWSKHGLSADSEDLQHDGSETSEDGEHIMPDDGSDTVLPTASMISNALNFSLDTAVSQGHKEITQILIKGGANLKTTIVDLAKYDRASDLRFLLSLGHERGSLGHADSTALRAAASEGFQDCVLVLLELGADASRVSPLHSHGHALGAAARNGHAEVVRILIDHGVNVDAYTEIATGDTALIVAAKEHGDDTAVARLLLERGADVNKHYGGSAGNALQVAAAHDYKDLCTLLLGHGADVDLPSGVPEMTPLEAARTKGSASVLDLLLKTQEGCLGP